MSRIKEHNAAIRLRKRKFSYSQIKERLGISKSTLSGWLKDYPLSRKRINELRAWNERRIEKFRETMREKREKRLRDGYIAQEKELLPLSKRELYIAGLFLYLGEGTKTKPHEASLSNSNPDVILFFMNWLLHICNVQKKKLKIKLHLYSDMNIRRETTFWSNLLVIPENQFLHPYIKKSKKKDITYKGGFNHGTCNIIVRDVVLFEKIIAGIKVVMSAF